MRLTRLFMVCALLGSPLLHADESFPGVQRLMRPGEFTEAGLHKLSKEELTALNLWLIRYTAQEAPILKKTTTEVKQEADKTIVSEIMGTFTGWTGKTIFRLKNGQTWQQRLKGTWKTRIDSPKVSISRNFLGFYTLEIEGSRRSIGVKRIQ